MSFEEATSIFLDPSAITFPDPDHSEAEDREITIGLPVKQRMLFVAHTVRKDRIRIISARRVTSAKRVADDIRAEYDLSRLKGGVRGKYYAAATAGANLVLLDPDVAEAFPDSASVNTALRLLQDVAAKASKRRRRPHRPRRATG